MGELPGSVLFACSQNAIRSPMAENILRYLHGRRIYVQSAGVRSSEIDPFAVEVMDEIGIDISRHRSRSFEQLDDDYFDLVISLSPEAQHRAVELDPAPAIASSSSGTCQTRAWSRAPARRRLDAYRALRDLLMRRIQQRFPVEVISRL